METSAKEAGIDSKWVHVPKNYVTSRENAKKIFHVSMYFSISHDIKKYINE